MNTKRKSRANTNSTGSRAPRTRASSSGGNGMNAQVSGADGIYLNETFMHRVTSLIGLEVEIVTHSKEMYSGILRTFSSNFDVVLELPHRTDPPPSSQAVGLKIVADKMIFKFDSIVKIAAYETDLDSMTRNTFQTDTTISKYNGQPLGEKVLEMWEPPSMNGDMEDFDLGSGNNNANGWDADDMFRRNEQEHGVTSTFDQNLSGYTTEIRTDLSNFKNEEAKAARLAREIESNPSSQNRANLENGDEEERFAAVSRPNNEISNSHDSKYMSGRRKPGPQQPTNSAYGLFNRNRKHPDKYPSSGSNERWECVSGSGTKNSNQNRGHAHQQNGSSNVVNKSTLPSYHNNTNQTYAANREPSVSVNGQSDKRSSASINSRRETSSSGPRHVSGRNNYSSNDNQSLPSSSRASPPTVQGHHNQISSVPPRYQTATYSQQTNTTNSRPNVSTSYAAAADKSVPKTQQPPTSVRVRDDNLNSELKRFSADFNLTSASPQNDLRVTSPALVVPETTPKQHPAQITHSEPPCPTVQEVSQVPEETTESPASPPQTLYQLQEGQTEKIVENIKKDQIEKSVEENATQLPDKTVVQTSKLNPNAKEFVFNPNTKPFIPRSPSTPNSSRPMTPQTPTTNIVASSGQHQQMIQAQHGPAIAIPAAYHHHHHQHAPGTGPMVTHQAPPHPHPAFTMLPTVFVTSNSAFNHHPHSMPPQPPNQTGRFRKIGMSHRSDLASQIQVAAATGQPLLAPAPLQAQFTVPGYSPQPMPTPQAYQQVQMVRMVPQQGGGMMPTLVPTSISYHPANASQLSQMESGVPQGPQSYHHHHHHQASQHHIMNQQQTAQSPAPQPGPPQTPGQSQTPVNFQQPPPQQSQPPPFPAGTTIMCPILPTPTASQQPPAPNTPGSAPPMQLPPPQQHPQQYISHPHPHHQTTSAPAHQGQYQIYSTIRES
ncbi:ataxin-2 homolog isoform X2 [Sipha flava]|uniref:Ataxin-2 homolog isoform X2 n=1 Tax=Sipha flava TaxID=143950 RepID=A0A8B8FKM2_9HEMI|nr:ataxin-2 homolog isoform X2 [Sipha flava]